MLKSLAIRELAIVDRLDLDFAPGLNVITGETGAGKSILIDALGLVSGGRADASLVRQGSERTEISAEFSLAGDSSAAAWLKDNDLDEAGELLLRRVLRSEGSSRAQVNGRPVPVQQLRELAASLIEIHGQHEHQALLNRGHQLDILDQYARAQAARQAVGAASRRWRELKRELDELRQQPSVGAELIGYLRHEIAELKPCDPRPERVQALSEQHRRLAHAGDLLSGLAHVRAALSGDDEHTAEAQLGQAAHELSRLLAFDPGLREPLEQLESIRIQLDEVGSTLERIEGRIDLDPEQLAALDADLARLHGLARKHRVGIDDLGAKLAELEARLDAAQNAGERAEAVAAALQSARQHYDEAARQLSAIRRAAAKKLQREVVTLMQELGMAGGQFVVDFESLDGDPRDSGAEQVEFLVSANRGVEPRPLRKVAAGGELARISLAIKVATIDLVDTPVLVFDEVDSGIGGGIAEVVGRKLRQLASRRQVFCVTHLAQVAACAHQHWQVSKRSQGQRTESAVRALDDQERVEELARMLGGLTITPETRALARDMLQRSRQEA